MRHTLDSAVKGGTTKRCTDGCSRSTNVLRDSAYACASLSVRCIFQPLPSHLFPLVFCISCPSHSASLLQNEVGARDQLDVGEARCKPDSHIRLLLEQRFKQHMPPVDKEPHRDRRPFQVPHISCRLPRGSLGNSVESGVGSTRIFF